jgi:hypothetical protein
MTTTVVVRSVRPNGSGLRRDGSLLPHQNSRQDITMTHEDRLSREDLIEIEFFPTSVIIHQGESSVGRVYLFMEEDTGIVEITKNSVPGWLPNWLTMA